MGKYEYLNDNGDFCLKDPELNSYLYFPLANEAGVMSSITPDMGGDSKLNQNVFLLPPASSENLHNDKSSRNIWCKIDGKDLWSFTGRSASQQAKLFTSQKDKTVLEAGFMHHTLTRNSYDYGLKVELASTVPHTGELMELTKITITNTSAHPRKIQLITAIPIYARSADNIRDHRHVTALLNRIQTKKYGIIVKPTLTFDERGHRENQIAYGVFAGSMKASPIGFYPIAEEFIGEGGSYENPKALYSELADALPADMEVGGYEAFGGICFQEQLIHAGESAELVVILSYGTSISDMEENARDIIEAGRFDSILEASKNYWNKQVNIRCKTGDADFGHWMRWVCFQPMLRRIYGCSFMPHHDYGKGGRGWRDLWQDCLALLLMNPDGVREMLLNNYGGVRLDGTNATIIGNGPGEFIADRNNITRVWMDHGVWPFITTDLYIQQTGDISILTEEKTYFKDFQICRGEDKDFEWDPNIGSCHMDIQGKEYTGTVLEHLLVQNISAFYDVGCHNHIKLHGADWNDALDLASENGESVAFTSMYGYNLGRLADLVDKLDKKGVSLSFHQELTILLEDDEELYNDITKKRALLHKYCKACSHAVDGTKKKMDATMLSQNLRNKGKWIKEHIRQNEWLIDGKGYSWYNGYYDNNKNRLEGELKKSACMMLTSQVFPIMSGTASQEQINEIVKSADQYLFKADIGGYRLNTNFHEIKMDMGRMFGFAYGHKENGAVFSHMTTMFSNALYKRGHVHEGYKALHTLYSHCNNFDKSKIYPGIPEYFDEKGRGVYHYLTGAASWMLLTVVTEMFGVKGNMGDLVFAPCLLKEQFDNKIAEIALPFSGRNIIVRYINENELDYGEYNIQEVRVNGRKIPSNVLSKSKLQKLDIGQTHEIEVILG